MKKVLLVVVMLLLAMPVMAATTISAVKEGTPVVVGTVQIQTVRIDYTSDVDVRAFALDINTDPGVSMKDIRNFKVGESNGAVAGGSSGYGIFPSRFRDFITPTSPDWSNPNYIPTPAWNEPETISPPTGMGFTKFTVEMGTLFKDDVNKPALSGTLFRFDVNNEGTVGTINLAIAANALRGGVVGADANGIVGVVFNGTSITFAAACTTPSNQVGNTRAAAIAAWTTEGFTNLVGTAGTQHCPADVVQTNDQICIDKAAALNYTYSVPVACPSVVGMSRSAAKTALEAAGYVLGADINVPPTTTYTTVRTCTAQLPALPYAACGATVNLSVVSYPIKDAAPGAGGALYANWVTNGRPQCWGYLRQCRGDADGKKLGTLWVSGNDLTILRANLSKNPLPPGGACADFDHKKLGTLWVSGNDLSILRANLSKAEASIPVCGTIPAVPSADANYWYWCIPTGGTACPSGQTCAPIGVCPNTP